MEGKKQMGLGSSSSSSSSLTTELFGPTDSSSSGPFGSIFGHQPKVLGRQSVRSELAGKKQDSANETWNHKPPSSDDASKSSDGYSSIPNKDGSSIYHAQTVQQPCHLSSSIYYGGQDVYNNPQNSQSSSMNSMFKKDGTEDDGTASRGNWWQGGLYY